MKENEMMNFKGFMKMASVVLAMTVANQVAVRFLKAEQTSETHEVKVIEWGWGTPSPVQALDILPKMQHRPFDGLVYTLSANGLHNFSDGKSRSRGFAWNAWGKERLTAEEFSESSKALKVLGHDRFTDNFLRFNVTPGNADWFDDEEFDAVVHNAALLARIAKDTGCNGIMFDVEIYQNSPWTYLDQAQADRGKGKSFDEYRQQVRKRGRQFMQAINAEYPGIQIMLTFGYNIAFKDVYPDIPLATVRYGLLPAFLDGVLEGADDKTEIHDGWESSYGYRVERHFVKSRRIMLEQGLEWTAAPDAYRRHYRAAFGLWMDKGGKSWDTKDFQENHLTPQEWAYSLHLARKHTDRYVWIYSHHVRPWSDKTPEPYWTAFKTAQQDQVTRPPMRLQPVTAGYGLINNGGFELGRHKDAAFVAKGWKKRTPEQFRGTLDTDTEHAHDGGACLKLEQTSKEDRNSIYQWPSMTRGKGYELSLWIRVQPKSPDATVQVNDVLKVSSWCYGVNKFAPWSRLSVAGDLVDGRWHKVTASFKAPAAATGTATYFDIRSTFLGTVWLDDIAIYEPMNGSDDDDRK